MIKKRLIYIPASRYFNVIGSDPEGRLGEAPIPELRAHGRIAGACFDAALCCFLDVSSYKDAVYCFSF